MDGDFALELSFCNEHGIPHSQFLNWEPSDRAKAKAYLIHKSEQCVRCATYPWEWEENRFAYEPVEKFCPGCHHLALSDDGARTMPGITIELAPTGTREAAARQLKMERRYREGR